MELPAALPKSQAGFLGTTAAGGSGEFGWICGCWGCWWLWCMLGWSLGAFLVCFSCCVQDWVEFFVAFADQIVCFEWHCW